MYKMCEKNGKNGILMRKKNFVYYLVFFFKKIQTKSAKPQPMLFRTKTLLNKLETFWSWLRHDDLIFHLSGPEKQREPNTAVNFYEKYFNKISFQLKFLR